MEWWTKLVTFALAVLGSVLGVLNTWRNMSKDRLKLRLSLTGDDTPKGNQLREISI
jgi:hypothetical protein